MRLTGRAILNAWSAEDSSEFIKACFTDCACDEGRTGGAAFDTVIAIVTYFHVLISTGVACERG